MLLMGVSLLFGFTGSLSLTPSAAARRRQPDGAGGGGADPARLFLKRRSCLPHLGARRLRGATVR